MKREAILLSGPRRSGTSKLPGALSRFSADLSASLIVAEEGVNASGSSGHVDVDSLHEWLPNHYGTGWGDLRSLPEYWGGSEETGPFRHKILFVVCRKLRESPLWVLKEVRMCRWLPL